MPDLLADRHGLGHENDRLAAVHVGMQRLDQRRVDRRLGFPLDDEIGAGATGSIVEFDEQLEGAERRQQHRRRHAFAEQLAVGIEIARREDTQRPASNRCCEC